MYTDQIFDIYISIYDDVRKKPNYFDYEREQVLYTMCHLNMIMCNWNIIQTSTDRAMDQALFDYNKASKGIKHHHQPHWENAHSFDEVGKKK